MKIPLVGKTFNGCLVVADAPNKVLSSGREVTQSLVECVCKKRFIASNAHLVSGHTRSCGCLKVKVTVERSFKHGHAKRGHVTRTHRAWTSMIWRCTNHKCPMWEYYGGEGIKVCEQWLNSFEDFYKDMGECPPGMITDRFPNPRGNYEPGNVRWATTEESNDNRRGVSSHTINGVTGNLKKLCRHFDISYGCVRRRIERGWAFERAVLTPNRNARNH